MFEKATWEHTAYKSIPALDWRLSKPFHRDENVMERVQFRTLSANFPHGGNVAFSAMR